MRRGKGERCHGFLSDNQEYAYCAREEYANGLERNLSSDTFAHKLIGECFCGRGHGYTTQAKSLTPRATAANSSRVVAEYNYTNEQGRVLFRVCRTEPKSFFQQRLDNNGEWINGLGETRRVLYRLPELLAADSKETVYVVEGEKCVETLRTQGLIATCNPCGAGKWLDIYSDFLEGRNVVLLPDNDTPGRNHAEQVSNSLIGIAASVKIVELPNLPEKGDIYDWLSNGGTIEELQRLVSSAENVTETFARESDRTKPHTSKTTVFIESATELLAREFPEPKWAVEGLLSEGATIFAGSPKTGKSRAALGLARCVATGEDALGSFSVTPGDVLYLGLEDGERRMQSRLRAMLGDNGVPQRLDLAYKWSRLNEGGLEAIENWLISHPEARLVVIDTLKRVRPQERRGGRFYDGDYDAVAPLNDLAQKYSVAILIIHHTNKANCEDWFDAISGTLGLSGAVDSAMLLKRKRGQNHGKLFAAGRDLEQDLELSIQADSTYGWIASWQEISSEREEISQSRRAILDFLEVNPCSLPKQVSDNTRISYGYVRRLLPEMLKDGLVSQDLSGGYSKVTGNSSNTVTEVTQVTGNSINLDNYPSIPAPKVTGNSSLFVNRSAPANSPTVTTVTTVTGDLPRSLFTPPSPRFADLNEWNEHAGILEFSNGLTQEEAERATMVLNRGGM